MRSWFEGTLCRDDARSNEGVSNAIPLHSFSALQISYGSPVWNFIKPIHVKMGDPNYLPMIQFRNHPFCRSTPNPKSFEQCPGSILSTLDERGRLARGVHRPHSLQWTLEIQHDLRDLIPGNYGILVES